MRDVHYMELAEKAIAQLCNPDARGAFLTVRSGADQNTMTVGGGEPQDNTPARSTGPSTEGREDVDRMAPLPEPEPLAKPGETLNRLKIRWEMIIRRAVPAPTENPT